MEMQWQGLMDPHGLDLAFWVEIIPKGFTLGVKADIEKKTFQSAPSY
jgi:hypothetical protein